MFILCCYLRCKVTKTEFGIVGFCRFLSVFVGFRNDAFSRCKVTKKKIGTVSLCQFVSVYVTLCHFPIYCLFLDAKLRKGNLALSPFVTFCHYLSPFVTFQQIAFSRCKVTEKKFGTVRICPEMSAFVRISFTLQSYEIEIWQCPNLSNYVQICPFNSATIPLSPKIIWNMLGKRLSLHARG